MIRKPKSLNNLLKPKQLVCLTRCLTCTADMIYKGHVSAASVISKATCEALTTCIGSRAQQTIDEKGQPVVSFYQATQACVV
jgi:hypothetical protein